MLKSLLKQSVSIADISIRFDNSALLFLEQAGMSIYDFKINLDNIIALLTAGSSHGSSHDCAHLPNNAISDILKNTAPDELITRITEAIKLALPEPVINDDPDYKPTQNNKIIDLKPLYYYFIDIMGRSEDEFWSSTLREIIERRDIYAENMGYKEVENKVQEFGEGLFK